MSGASFASNMPPLYNPTFWPLFTLTLSILVALLSQHDWHLPKLLSCQIYAIVSIITPDSSAFNGVILLASPLATFERAPNQSGNPWQLWALWSWSWIAGYQSIELHCSAVFRKNIPMTVNLHHCRFQLKSHEPDIAKFYQGMDNHICSQIEYNNSKQYSNDKLITRF